MARPRVEVVHVGSACRDVVPEDPRGWRLGGGVTYASLTTARLGLRTAAIVGVDADRGHGERARHARATPASTCCCVPLDEGPIFHNLETPKGRVQTCVLTGVAAAGPGRARVLARGARLVGGPGGGRGAPTTGPMRPGGCAPGRRVAGLPARPGGRGAGPPPAAGAVADPAPRRSRRGQPPRRSGRRRPSPTCTRCSSRARTCSSPRAPTAGC